MPRTTLHLALISAASALDICGNYCGPTWCDGRAVPECPVGGKSCKRDANTCTESGPTDGSCADECCKDHDACCGSGDRTVCNVNIIKCLKACPSGPGSKGKDCYHGLLPVPVDAVLVGMELDPYGCCGTACDDSSKAREANETQPEAQAAAITKASATTDDEHQRSRSMSSRSLQDVPE